MSSVWSANDCSSDLSQYFSSDMYEVSRCCGDHLQASRTAVSMLIHTRTDESESFYLLTTLAMLQAEQDQAAVTVLPRDQQQLV